METKVLLNGIEVTQPTSSKAKTIEDMVDYSCKNSFKEGTIRGFICEGEIVKFEDFKQSKNGYYKVKTVNYDKENKKWFFDFRLLKELN